eukprot:3832376-Alexandrium_andersonii.AAC.1
MAKAATNVAKAGSCRRSQPAIHCKHCCRNSGDCNSRLAGRASGGGRSNARNMRATHWRINEKRPGRPEPHF